MNFKLKSVRKPADTEAGALEAWAAPVSGDKIAERITPAPDGPPSKISELVRRRIVIGKSKDSIAPPVENGLETVFNADERTRIVSTDQYPWKLICALEIDAMTGTYVGTGWVVGPRTLITAGHCVFDSKQMGGWAREIRVTPGRDRERRPFGSFVARRFSTLNLWTEKQDADYDIAAIHLDADLFPATEAFRVGALPDEELQDYLINVSGYPASPGGGTELYWAKNRIRAVTTRRIFYDVDTSGGQSGGPAYVFPDENAHPVVVGIHAYGEGGTPGSIAMRVNSAPRVLPEVVEQIEAWRGGDMETS
ncbi:trypsin-like serine peptidase [Mesorhizobium sp. f-mel]